MDLPPPKKKGKKLDSISWPLQAVQSPCTRLSFPAKHAGLVHSQTQFQGPYSDASKDKARREPQGRAHVPELPPLVPTSHPQLSACSHRDARSSEEA